MIYTVDELKKLIQKDELAEASRHCEVSYSTLWRIWEGKQEPKESTLIMLKKYVEMVYDPK